MWPPRWSSQQGSTGHGPVAIASQTPRRPVEPLLSSATDDEFVAETRGNGENIRSLVWDRRAEASVVIGPRQHVVGVQQRLRDLVAHPVPEPDRGRRGRWWPSGRSGRG